jgi:hypothetical protein
LRRGFGGFAPTLSPLVSWAQSCLTQLVGPWVPQDAILGAATRQAIIQFQTQQSLPPTGALDDVTTQALQSACTAQAGIPDSVAAPPPPALQPPAAAAPPPPPRPRRQGAPPPGEIGEGELPTDELGAAGPRHYGRWLRHRSGDQEAFSDELHDVEEPYPPPQWPPSRRFHPPPAQIIPTGPYQTFSPCSAVLDDFSRLAVAADDLKDALREQPPDLARIANRADVVTAVSREIVTRLSSRSYVRVGCIREDLDTLASSVNVLRGPGGDAEVGSWPPARSAREQGPRRQARESLRHLLAWCRRAASRFPDI